MEFDFGIWVAFRAVPVETWSTCKDRAPDVQMTFCTVRRAFWTYKGPFALGMVELHGWSVAKFSRLSVNDAAS